MNYKELLLEIRRKETEDYLYNIPDNKKYYVHFSDIDMLVISPRPLDETTPAGIYAYPVSVVKEKGITNLPYAGWKKYIYVISPKTNARIFNLPDVKDEDINLLISILKNKYSLDVNLQDFSNEKDKATLFWNILKWASAELSSGNSRSMPFKMNKILRDMNIDIVEDNRGIIHWHEPQQVVILDPSKVKVEKVLYNPYYVSQTTNVKSSEPIKSSFLNYGKNLLQDILFVLLKTKFDFDNERDLNNIIIRLKEKYPKILISDLENVLYDMKPIILKIYNISTINGRYNPLYAALVSSYFHDEIKRLFESKGFNPYISYNELIERVFYYFIDNNSEKLLSFIKDLIENENDTVKKWIDSILLHMLYGIKLQTFKWNRKNIDTLSYIFRKKFSSVYFGDVFDPVILILLLSSNQTDNDLAVEILKNRFSSEIAEIIRFYIDSLKKHLSQEKVEFDRLLSVYSSLLDFFVQFELFLEDKNFPLDWNKLKNLLKKLEKEDSKKILIRIKKIL